MQSQLMDITLSKFPMEFNMDFLSGDFMNKLTKKSLSTLNDDRSRARSDQRMLIKHLSKNLLFEILSYLQSNEIFSLIKSSKTLKQKLTNDPLFHKTVVEAYFAFYFQQFVKASPEIELKIQSLYSNNSRGHQTPPLQLHPQGSGVSYAAFSTIC